MGLVPIALGLCSQETRFLQKNNVIAFSSIYLFWAIGAVVKAKCSPGAKNKHFAARLTLSRALQGVRKREKHRVRGPQSK